MNTTHLTRILGAARQRLTKAALLAAAILMSQAVQAETIGDWQVGCRGEQCQALQQLFTGEGEKRSRILSASLSKIKDQLVLQLVLPLGVDLRPGIVIRIDESEEQRLGYTTCVADGCVVLTPLNDTLYAGMKAGKTMKVGFRPFNSEQTLVVEVSLSGFTKASSKVR